MSVGTEEVAAEPEVKSTRRRKAESDGAKEPPAFRPMVTKINAIAKRTVRTGNYESFEISTMVEAERDPNYSVQHNISMINQLVTQEVNEMADEVRKSVEVER